MSMLDSKSSSTMGKIEVQADKFEISDVEYTDAAKKYQKILANLPLAMFVEWLKFNDLTEDAQKTALQNTDRDSIVRHASGLALLHPRSIAFRKLARATLIRRLISSVLFGGPESATRLATNVLTRFEASKADASGSIENQIWW